ncbi:transmembrane protein 54b isoform X2 [Anabas testudineus]|uniref:transmembrane protein 54b isoform X2 n=1 Tax=Anabas testudineus TaxID=64144 RepID=UPI000E462C00|nr:transmembrane protein 54b isoform X2 [Anabas testudineus]
MAGTGLCCGSLEEPKALMKMGLCLVFVGHVNFLLGALVHGVVLRHISLSNHNTAVEVVISNVVALVTGLIGTVVGILAIILSKNKKSRGLTWSLFSVSLGAAVMAAASAIGLFVSVVIAIVQNGRSLLAYCRFPDAIGYSAVNNECPFDPTRVNALFYSSVLEMDCQARSAAQLHPHISATLAF